MMPNSSVVGIKGNPIVGFTGTRSGMTALQSATVDGMLEGLRPREFHHGDCVGADAQAHELARAARLRIIIHPPEYGRFRAWCLGAASVLDVKPFMARNEDIVAACEILIAAPAQANEVIRSGTWATVRRAMKARKPVCLVQPDGGIRNLHGVPVDGWDVFLGERDIVAALPAVRLAVELRGGDALEPADDTGARL